MLAIANVLKKAKLRDTQPRRLVLQELMKTNSPKTHKEIYEAITSAGNAINLVTVYRVLEKFTEIGLVHKHLSTGGVVICSLPEEHGHHVLLSCSDCGKVEEQCDTELCQHEDRLAKKAGFTPKEHLSEVIGVCSSCQ